MFGRLYHLPEQVVRRRADELLEQFGLTEAAGRVVKTYSGGMRRRLDIAASLIVAPPVLFLDEPTTGLDPRSRSDVWTSLRELVATGTTVVLTTQYLDEADQLADHIAVIDTGRVIAAGTSAQLKTQIGGDRLEVVVRDAGSLAAASSVMAGVTSARPHVAHAARRITIPVHDGPAAVMTTLRELDRAGILTEDIGLHRPTLDDVFLRLTGRAASAAESADPPANPDHSGQPGSHLAGRAA
jgi:ABC-2 type transport system ATP-binding protein